MLYIDSGFNQFVTDLNLYRLSGLYKPRGFSKPSGFGSRFSNFFNSNIIHLNDRSGIE
jgi:hypothetical protein